MYIQVALEIQVAWGMLLYLGSLVLSLFEVAWRLLLFSGRLGMSFCPGRCRHIQVAWWLSLHSGSLEDVIIF
jgi:hypothetical protein